MIWILNNWRIVVVGMLLLSSFTAGYKLKELRVAAKMRDELVLSSVEFSKKEKQFADISTKYEREILTLRSNNRRINALLDHEFKNSPNNCLVGAVRVRAINQAIDTNNSAKSLQ